MKAKKVTYFVINYNLSGTIKVNKKKLTV